MKLRKDMKELLRLIHKSDRLITAVTKEINRLKNKHTEHFHCMKVMCPYREHQGGYICTHEKAECNFCFEYDCPLINGTK